MASSRRGMLVLLMGLCGCGGSADGVATAPNPSAELPPAASGLALRARPAQRPVADGAETAFPSSIRLQEVGRDWGVDFVHSNGAVGRKLMVESITGGGGWLDYDRDGFPDLYCVQGGNPTPGPETDQPRDRLFRNLGGRGFVDVTDRALPVEQEYGNGVSVGDYDEDGFPDVYVTNAGTNRFYRNLGDGTFEDITEWTRTGDPRWSSSAAWGDLDGDGDLDLFVCNYLKYDPWQPLRCTDKQGNHGICHPGQVEPESNACYRNNGDGTFTEVADAWGLQGPGSKSLGVVIADFDRDGRMDVFVANDTTANFLFVGQSGGSFREVGYLQGCAISALGETQASMGIAFGDYDRNGYFDLYCTHFTTDSNTLYRNLGGAGFEDVTRSSGLHQPTLRYLAFGTVFADFDADGRMDLLVGNGHIDDQWEGEPLEMSPQLFSWQGKTWRELSSESGEWFAGGYVSRAVATADFDRDGAVDVVVINQNAPLSLVRNVSQRGHWLNVDLIGRTSNRFGIHAHVTVTCGDDVLHGELPGGSSYCAAHEPRHFFGLGAGARACRLEVVWPDGSRDSVDDVEVNQTVTVMQGRGIVDCRPVDAPEGP
jgi:enediyne biosynthesis protein E4